MKNRKNFAWTLAIVMFLCVGGGVFAQKAASAGSREEIPPPNIGEGLPFLSTEHTPSLAYNSSKQRIELVVPHKGDAYVNNVAYATFSAKSGWSAPVLITNLPHDVRNAHVAVTANGTVLVAFEVAESLNRVYVMARSGNSGEWSAPAIVSDPAVPAHEPRILVSNSEVTVVFRTSTGDETNSNRVIVVGLQENIPIW